MTMLFFAFLEYANMTFPARQRLAASVRLALARGLSTTCGTVQRGIVSPAFSTRVWYAPEMAVTPRAPAEETTHCPPSKNAPRSPQPQATTLPSFLRARLWNLPAAIAVTPVAAAAGTVHCPSTMALATALYKPSLDRLGDPLGDRRHGQVRVRPRDVGDHRRVRDDEPFVAEDAAALVDDRTPRASRRSAHRRSPRRRGRAGPRRPEDLRCRSGAGFPATRMRLPRRPPSPRAARPAPSRRPPRASLPGARGLRSCRRGRSGSPARGRGRRRRTQRSSARPRRRSPSGGSRRPRRPPRRAGARERARRARGRAFAARAPRGAGTARAPRSSSLGPSRSRTVRPRAG